MRGSRKKYYRRYEKPKLTIAYVQTIGEFEALLSALSSLDDPGDVVIFMPKPYKKNKLMLANIDFLADLSGLRIKIQFRRFIFILFVLFKYKFTNTTAIVAINCFDERHSVWFRHLIHFLADYMVRDSFCEHDFPPYEGGNNFFLPLLLERGLDGSAYDGMLTLRLGRSKYRDKLLDYLAAPSQKAAESTGLRLLVISKNVRKNDLDLRQEYIRTFLEYDFKCLNKLISVLPHPRDEKYDLLISQQGLTTPFYQQIKDADLILVLGGSSGWLLDYVPWMIYADDPIFNRGSFGRIRFKDKNVVSHPSEIIDIIPSVRLQVNVLGER